MMGYFGHRTLLILFSILLLLPCASYTQEGYNQVIRGQIKLTTQHLKVIPLKGEWRLFANELLSPQEIARRTDHTYAQVPTTWDALVQKIPQIKQEGNATYQLTIQTSSTNNTLAIHFPYIASASRVYVNDRLVFKSGIVGSTKQQTKLSWLTGVAHLGKPDSMGIIRITIQVANYDYFRGGFQSVPTLGNLKAINEKRNKNIFSSLFLLGSLLVIGLYHFVLFFLRRQDRTTLYFGAFCLTIAVRILFSGEHIIYIIMPGISFHFFYLTYMLTQTIGAAFFILYVAHLFPQETEKISVRIGISILIAQSIYLMVIPLKLISQSGPFLDIYTLFAGVYIILTILRAALRKRQGSFLVAFGTVILVLTILNDILSENQIIISSLLLPTGVFILIFSQAILLSIRFSNAFHTVEKLSHTLEKKVQLRTNELELEKNRLKQQNNIMEHEIKLARKIQRHFIPSNSPSDSIAFYYQPVSEVGGDFFDFIQYSDGSMGVLLSDVSGHGVPAAFVTSMIKSFTLQYGTEIKSPSKFLAALNDFLLNLTCGDFVTSFYGILKPGTKKFIYANAGHNDPYLLDINGARLIKDGQKGLPLAIMDQEKQSSIGKEYRDNELQLDEKSKLFLYTDGLTEALSISESMQGDSSGGRTFEQHGLPYVLADIKQANCKEIINSMQKELIRFRGSNEFEDDVCMICLDI